MLFEFKTFSNIRDIFVDLNSINECTNLVLALTSKVHIINSTEMRMYDKQGLRHSRHSLNEGETYAFEVSRLFAAVSREQHRVTSKGSPYGN